MKLLVLIFPFILLEIVNAQEAGCPQLSWDMNVDGMKKGNDDYAYQFYENDVVEITCYQDYIIPWKTALTRKGVIKCADDGNGKVTWIGQDMEVDWTYRTGFGYTVCVDCVYDHVGCNNGECTRANTCNCNTDFQNDLMYPRECFSRTCLTDRTYCENNSDCYENYKGLTCTCKDGTSGTTCDQITTCTPNPCKNDATCERDTTDPQVYDKYICTCKEGFVGEQCETELTCPGDTDCQNGGTCEVDLDNEDVKCNCPANFKGANCEEEIPCPADHCKNNAVCTVLGEDSFQCECKPGTGGDNCEYFTIEPCEDSPCENGGSCERDETDFTARTCTCTDGFSGDSCQDADVVEPSDVEGCDPATDVNCDHGKNSATVRIFGNIVPVCVMVLLVGFY